MKTITIDDKKIEISDKSYEAFKKQFVTKDKAILWKPQRGDSYWTNSEYYLSIVSECEDDKTDRLRYELGNIFKTKEEAEEALKTGWIAKRKAEVEILRFIAENDLEHELDWNRTELFWTIVYDFTQTNPHFEITHWDHWIVSPLPCFKSEADAQKVIDAMTPQLKILFGVRG